MEVDKDLEKIAEYLSVCLGRDDSSRKELAFHGVKPGDIGEEAKKDVEKAMDVLGNTEKDPAERINTVLAVLKDISEEVPPAVDKYVLRPIRNRLNEAAADYALEGGRPSALFGPKPWSRGVFSHLNTSYSLDLFLSDDRKVLLELKKLGVKDVPPVVKDIAKRAKAVLEDDNLTPEERAIKAVDILMEPLLPTYSGDRTRKDIQGLSPEVKGVIWQIADELAASAY